MTTSSLIRELFTMIRHRFSFYLFLGLSSSALSACTVVVDSGRVQCKTDLDCTAGGPGSVCTDSVCQPDPTWACLDDGTPDEAPSGTVHVVMTMEDLLSQKPVAGVTLTLCAKLDANCDFAIAQYQSNEAGRLDVELPAGFDGYFQSEGGGVYPTMFFPPNTRKQRAPSTLPMVPNSFFATMFSGIGGTVSADRSVIMTTALDCRGMPAAGMALASPQADDRTVNYVLQGGLPSRTSSTTDDTGAGGFVNIKSGGAVVTSTMASTNRLVGTVAVQTRPGHLSMVLVMPTGS
jgi:hypothetical protein